MFRRVIEALRGPWPRGLPKAWALSWLLSLGIGLIGLWGAQAALGLTVEQPEAMDVVGELTAGTFAGQTFVAHNPHLAQVDVRLGLWGRALQGPVVFHLRRWPDGGTDLRTVAFDAAQVIENGFYDIRFAPLENEAGEMLEFTLEAPQAQPGHALTVWGTRREGAFPEGHALFSPGFGRGLTALNFRLHYALSLGEVLSGLTGRLTAGKPGLAGQPAFYLELVVAYLAWLALTGIVFIAKPAEDAALETLGGPDLRPPPQNHPPND